MSTHAAIAITDGTTCKAIYLHSSGYIGWAGWILANWYNSKEKATALISLGNLSSLKKKLGPDKDVPHDFDHPAEDVTVAYCRDRDEPLRIKEYKDIAQITDEKLIKRLARYTGANYIYLFDERKNQWLVGVAYQFLSDEKKAYPGAKTLAFYPLLSEV